MRPITNIHDLDFSKTYTYADYLTWRLHDRVELIMGKIFRMSPAPHASHQLISAALTSNIHQFPKGKKCRVFAAPFDVRLPSSDTTLDNTENVVQPDICVVCDLSKVDARGCKGAPDFVVEIISKASVGKSSREIQSVSAVRSEGVLDHSSLRKNIEYKCAWRRRRLSPQQASDERRFSRE